MEKKTENYPENCPENRPDTENMVLVNASLLGQGLKTTFQGMAMVFGSLGAGAAATEIKGEADKPMATALQEAGGTAVAEQAAPVSSGTAVVSDDTSEEDGLPFETQPTPADLAESGKDAELTGTTTEPASVTIDDITKVIVTKIKQKRSNNAKIGALLKTYGVEKVSLLPAEKYEAFLTDISQL